LKKTSNVQDLLKRPQINQANIRALIDLPYNEEVMETIEIEIKYAGYIDKVEQQIKRSADADLQIIPDGIIYGSVKNLSLEAVEKMEKIRPVTIGQASRIAGISPVDITMLLISLKINQYDKL